MSYDQKSMAKAEAFVRDVLSKNFNQKVDSETLRTVAEKVSRAVAINSPEKSA